MHPTVKTILVLVAGVVLGGLVIALVEAAGHQLIAMPENVNFEDPAQLADYVNQVPLAGKLFVVAAWGLGMFAGAALAVRLLDRKRWPATAIVLFLLGATSLNFVMIPHPVWMMVAAVVVAALAWLAATRFAVKQTN